MNSRLLQDIIHRVNRHNAPSPFIVSVVGAGGKSSTLQILAYHLARNGYKTGLITTTKMSIAEPYCSDLDDWKAQLRHNGYALFARRSDDVHISAPNAAELSVIRQSCDVILVEADGSKRLPFKVPVEYEPVILPETSLVLLMFGLSAAGKDLQDICFRYPRALKTAQENNFTITADTVLDPALAANLLYYGYIENKLSVYEQAAEVILIANQYDLLQDQSWFHTFKEEWRHLSRTPCYANDYTEDERHLRNNYGSRNE